MTFLLFNLSCKTTQLKFDRKYKQNFYSEPKLNEEINQFLKNNGDKILREKSVEDLLDLQSCEKPSNCRYNDFPNDFESILKFNKLLSKEQFVWIHHPDYINLKNQHEELLKLYKNIKRELDDIKNPKQQINNNNKNYEISTRG